MIARERGKEKEKRTGGHHCLRELYVLVLNCTQNALHREMTQ